MGIGLFDSTTVFAAVAARNALAVATSLQATNDNADNPIDNIVDWARHRRFIPTAASTTITAILPTAQTISCIALAGYDLLGATIAWEYSQDGGGIWQQLYPPGQIVGPEIFARLVAAVTADALRITISGGSGAVEIAHLFIGDILAIPEAIVAPFDDPRLVREAVLNTQRNRDGQYLASAIERLEGRSSVSFEHVDQIWVETYWIAFRRFIIGGQPFYFLFGADIGAGTAAAWVHDHNFRDQHTMPGFYTIGWHAFMEVV